MKDYYKVLGVDQRSSWTEIKKTFRRKALLIHPDRSRANTNNEFIELFEAYEVLSDRKKRDRYDKLYRLFFDETKEVEDAGLKTEIKLIVEKGRVYAEDFKKFNREILVLIVLELFFDPSYVLFAACASIFFGIWTILRGLMMFGWSYSLIGLILTVTGLVLARLKFVEIKKAAR